MTLQKRAIAKNIKLSYLYTKKFKTDSLSFTLYTPLTARAYLYSLVLVGVMRRGSEAYPSMRELNRELDMLYASTVDVQSGIYGNTLTFTVSAELIAARFAIDGTDVSDGVIRLIADVLLHPLRDGGCFPSDTVEKEKQLVSDALRAERNNPRSYAATRLKELMRRGNGEYPTLEYLLSEVANVTPEALGAYYDSLTASAPMNVFYVGSESADAVSGKIANAFGAYTATESYLPKPPSAEPARPPVDVTEDMPVSQGKLCIGLRSGACFTDGGYHAAIVFNEILGASPASKLFMNVRERLSLCYYCSSAYSTVSGELSISCGVDASNRERAEAEIMRQLGEIADGNISDTEFFAAKRSLEYTYAQLYDSPFSLRAFYTDRELAGIEENVEECKHALLSVTREQVAQTAAKAVADTRFFINGSGGEEVENDD